jgi:hypothetical protein
MDTIPKQAVIDAIEGCKSNTTDHEGCIYDDGLDAALAAINAIPAVEEWQPIETAPKDGTLVDLWCKLNGVGRGVRRTDKKYAADSYSPNFPPCWGPYDGMEEGPLQPTHWRPLPKPPLLAALGE